MMMGNLKRVILLSLVLALGFVLELGVEMKTGYAGVLHTSPSAEETLFFTMYGTQSADQEMGISNNQTEERLALKVIRVKDSDLILGVSEARGDKAQECFKLVPHNMMKRFLHIHEKLNCDEVKNLLELN